MCQLLGMNCNFPTDICFSFEGFHVRGGKTDDHKDGWGIAFFEGPGVRVFLDSKATIESPVAEMVRRYPIHSTNVIAHIRRATLGKIALENTHPFMRECWGRYWIFAHNGTLKGFAPPLNGRYKPVGQTDSELAFCYLMESLQARFPLAHPSRDELFQALDGITGAAFGVMIPLVIADITHRTGRFNLAMGMVALVGGIGAVLGNPLAGWLADRLGENIAFVGLAAAGLAAFLVIARWMPETREDFAFPTEAEG